MALSTKVGGCQGEDSSQDKVNLAFSGTAQMCLGLVSAEGPGEPVLLGSWMGPSRERDQVWVGMSRVFFTRP